MAGVVVVTGAAPFSLGEQIVLDILTRFPGRKVIVVDKQLNRSLEGKIGDRGVYLEQNLNFFESESLNGEGFERRLVEILTGALNSIGADSIDTLFNNAGVYDFGDLESMSFHKICRLLGVNVFGHISVLRAVMAVNRARGIDNRALLRLCETGSFQGLTARGGRAVYCLTKGGMIDFCQALADGELQKVVYIVPPAIDTPMLDFNLWVTKAGGGEDFWKSLYTKNLVAYRKIFTEVDKAAFVEYLDSFDGQASIGLFGREKLVRAFERYREVRKQYFTAKEGVATVQEISETAVRHTLGDNYPSAIVLCTVHNSVTGRTYGDIWKHLVYEGSGGGLPFSKMLAMKCAPI